MGNYVRDANYGVVIAGVTADEPASYLRFGVSALRQLGVNVADVRWRGSFAFVAQKGYPSKTVFDKVLSERASSSEPAQLHVTIEGTQTLCGKCDNALYAYQGWEINSSKNCKTL